ncbi:MAG TPA: hypothetical protein VJ715_04265 [Pyrinomonadaceae bacterium]|nr:hypothetical protein [Pyrinomonadaceae bacterium]
MSVKINWSCNVQVIGGPKLSGADTVEVDAYDNIEVTVPKKPAGPNNGSATVEVQPGAQTKVMFLLIQAGTYQGGPLSYKVDGSSKPFVRLDAQQLMIGSGAVSLLDGAPTKLVFENTGAADIPVRILIGRKAI